MASENQTRSSSGPPANTNNGRDLVRVVIQSPDIWGLKGLTRQFSSRQGFVLLQRGGTFESVLSDCEKMAPCVLIVDQVLMQTDGLDVDHFSSRVEYGRSIQVLVVGPKRDPGLVEELLRMGCAGFVTPDISPAMLKKAVRAVVSGEYWADRRSTSRVVRQLLSQSGSRALTPREKQVLWLIGRGLKNRAIAERLYITRDTVRWHIRSIYAKIGVQDRLSAALYAQEHLGEGIALDPRSSSEEPLLVDSIVGRETGRQPRFLQLNSRYSDD